MQLTYNFRPDLVLKLTEVFWSIYYVCCSSTVEEKKQKLLVREEGDREQQEKGRGQPRYVQSV